MNDAYVVRLTNHIIKFQFWMETINFDQFEHLLPKALRLQQRTKLTSLSCR